MSMPSRAVLGCLGAIGLALVGAGTLVVLNWDVVSRDVAEALGTQTERAQATLFRLGEVLSISAELKDRYGAEPDVSYDTATGERILSISFSDYRLPGNVTGRSHAREIAAFAIDSTTKFDRIDTVRVLFQTPSAMGAVEPPDGSQSYSFALDELMPGRAQGEPTEPAEPAAE